MSSVQFFRYISGAICFASGLLWAMSCSFNITEEEANDPSVYVIDLAKFDIPNSSNYKDRAVAIATTRGINNALNYAKENGYRTVKFPKRQYAIISEWQGWGWVDIPEHDLKGIVVPSDITLELGEAVFRLLPNNQVTYSLFYIFEVENIAINGGHLIGDRYEHDYSLSETLGSATHEWGFGFNIAHSKNVTIKGAKVEQMSGDAVILNSYLPEGAIPNEKVQITNCELYDCRRQGISLVAGNNSELCYNHIYGIKNGTLPMWGIDIEVEAAYGCVGNYTRIHHNLIEDVEGGAIVCHTGDYIDVYENTGYSSIATVFSRHVKIYRNTIHNGQIIIYDADNAIEYENTIRQD